MRRGRREENSPIGCKPVTSYYFTAISVQARRRWPKVSLPDLASKDLISSPSFVLINEYEIATDAIPGRLFHVDLYRLRERSDLESIGFAEIVAPPNLSRWWNGRSERLTCSPITTS